MIVRSLLTLLGFQTDGKGQQALRGYEKGLTAIFSAAKMAAVGIAAFGAAAFKAAGDLEQTEIAFETMLGSGEAANKLIQEITTFAAQTPFELKGLVDSSKQLLAFGFAAESIIPTMTTLGDIAAGVGRDKLETIVRSLGKIRTKGKASMEELNMMLEAGVPVLDALSNRLGVTQQALFKMISKGQVSFEDVNQALTDLTTGTGKFAGLMKKQSKSFLGIISNIGDFLYNLTTTIGKDLLPIGKELATAFLGFLEVNREIMRGGIVSFFKGLVFWITLIIRFVQRLLDRFGGVGAINKVIGDLLKIISDVAMILIKYVFKAIVQIFDAVKLLINAFGGWDAINKVIGDFFKWYAGYLGKVISGLASYISWFIKLYAKIIPIIRVVLDFLKQVYKFFKPGIDAIGGFASSVFDKVKSVGQSAWEKILEFFVIFGKALRKLWDGFVPFFQNLWNGVGDFLKSIWDGFLNVLDTVGAAILKIWNGIVDGIKGLWEGAVNFVMSLWQGVLDFIESIKNFGQGVADFFGGVFGGKKGTNMTGSSPPAGIPTNTTPSKGGVNVNSTVTIGVPAGTPAEQKAYVEKSADAAIKKAWESVLREGFVNSPAGAK